MNATAQKRHVVIVEDDARIADMLANYLQAQGFATTWVGDGLRAVPEVRRIQPSVVLLDLNLPGQHGIEVCRAIRSFSAVPLVMVTARVEEVDRLVGLDVGADDYVCKPFSPREVVARIQALLRRAEGRVGPALGSGGFRVDEAARRIAFEEHWLPLTPIEYRLLRHLVARPGHVFSRNALLQCVHDEFRDTTDRAIDSHVKNLRRKILQVRPQGSAIASVYGAGYRFDPLEATGD